MEKENFERLFEDYIICIPAIQREYVQGYNEKQTNIVRENFINDIFKAISTDDILDVGIIYGYTQKEESVAKSIFFPVDGQQRITTLYVIYWCLNMMKTETNNNIDDKILKYEVRNSTTRFFKELVNKERFIFFRECFSEEKSFYESLVSQAWFESQWLNDGTVLAVINVISEISQKIKEFGGEKFCDKALNSFSKNIRFSLITFNNDDKTARRSSSLEFTKLNARGKQLELFENVKAYLNIIEEKLENKNSFTYNYDAKFIDLFYDSCKMYEDLEDITKNINNKTILLLINAYNLLGEIEEKREKLKDELDYLTLVIEVSKNYKESDKDFWRKYISFLNNIFQTFFKLNSLDELNSFSSGIINYDKYKDTNKLVSRLLYYNHFYDKHNNYVSKEIKEQYDYVLDNLKYSDWAEHNIKEINPFIDEISKYDDIIDYFDNLEDEISKYDNITDYFDNLEDENNLKVFMSNGIIFRLNEQSIKAKIIKEEKLKYDYFKMLESRSNHRSINYLLYFSGYWDFEKTNNKGNFKKLEQYLKVAEEFFFENNIEVHKIFALAVNYNVETDQLMESDEINKRTNMLFINPISKAYLDYNNLHYWEDIYYFIKDNLDKNNKLIRRVKLDYLKLAYDFYINKKISDLYKYISEERYNNCWLKYAIQRKDIELFERKISFSEHKLYIQLEGKEIPEDSKNSLNFFAYLYLLDKKQDEFSSFQFRSPVYYLCTKNVRDTRIYNRYLDFDNLEKNKIINPFELNIIWEKQRERMWKTRDFFYYKYILELLCDKDSLIELDGDIISKISFDKNSEIKSKLLYNFKGYRDKIEELIKNEEKTMEALKDKMKLYHSCLEPESKSKMAEKVEEYISKNYNHVAGYNYNYINKYLSKESKKVDISAYKHIN